MLWSVWKWTRPEGIFRRKKKEELTCNRWATRRLKAPYDTVEIRREIIRKMIGWRPTWSPTHRNTFCNRDRQPGTLFHKRRPSELTNMYMLRFLEELAGRAPWPGANTHLRTRLKPRISKEKERRRRMKGTKNRRRDGDEESERKEWRKAGDKGGFLGN